MSRRSLVFVTQQVDPEHPLLAATVPKIRALAERLDEVVVLADRAVPGVLPDNCRVVEFGAPTRAARGRHYVAALNRELGSQPLAILVHMIPLLAVVGAPVARARRVPILLWFTHWKPSRTLVLAERVSKAILTVDRRSFPLSSPKVIPIGHGIDLASFPCARRDRAERLRVVALGRTSPAKGYEAIARAATLADVDLELRGPSFTDEERAERTRLESLGARVDEPVAYRDVPALLMRKDVLVNNMREGSLDKVVYEAAATCMPVLASNSGFEDVLPPELRFRRDDVEDLADKLRRLKDANRDEVGLALRAAVEERHSVDHWADSVIRAAAR